MYFLFLSEPPDLNNWFSEYVYESTVLSTSDEFEDSLFVERGPEIDELVAEDSNVENEDKLVTIKGVQSRDQQGVVKKGHSNGFVKHNTYEVVKQKYESLSKVFFSHLSPVTFLCLKKLYSS